MERMRGGIGRIIVYTGNGQGKTTASLGIALRSIAHNKKVVVIQFMKGRKDVGEFLARKFLPNYEIHQFGREGFVDLSKPSEEDKLLAKKAMSFAIEKLREKPYLMILDEINLAMHIGLISTKEVLKLIDLKPPETNLILTGRNAGREIIERADVVTEMRDIKRTKIEAREGIEY